MEEQGDGMRMLRRKARSLKLAWMADNDNVGRSRKGAFDKSAKRETSKSRYLSLNTRGKTR